MARALEAPARLTATVMRTADLASNTPHQACDHLLGYSNIASLIRRLQDQQRAAQRRGFTRLAKDLSDVIRVLHVLHDYD